MNDYRKKDSIIGTALDDLEGSLQAAAMDHRQRGNWLDEDCERDIAYEFARWLWNEFNTRKQR